MTLLSAVVTLALWIPGTTTGATIAFGTIYGFASGGIVSLSPAVIAQISDVREVGTRSGVLYFCGSFGALIGPPIAGAIVTAQDGDYLGLKLFNGLTLLLGALCMYLSRATQVGVRLVKI